MNGWIDEQEVNRLKSCAAGSFQRTLYERLQGRVCSYAGSVEYGFTDSICLPEDTWEWYYLVWGRLADASFVYAVEGDAGLGVWIHDRVMEIVELPEEKWFGPDMRRWYREHKIGCLETAYITLALCETAQNAQDVFSEGERHEIRRVLENRGLVLCENFMKLVGVPETAERIPMNNWCMVLNSAYGIAAAVLGRKGDVEKAVYINRLLVECFQEDCYGETLQYSGMAAFYMYRLHEVLIRMGYADNKSLHMEGYTRMITWYAVSLQSMDYYESLRQQAPVMFNFSDSSVSFRPSGDLLAGIACRQKREYPREAGLAAWLFGRLYGEEDAEGICPYPYGYCHSYFAVLMQPDMASELTPAKARLPLDLRFSNGQIFLRDSWDKPRAMLALAAGYEPLKTAYHRHSDQNSFQLTVGRERMIAAPGNCCYRLKTQAEGMEESSHSTVSLLFREHAARQERIDGINLRNPQPVKNRLLCYGRFRDVTVIASDAAGLYEKEVHRAVRVWISCMPGMLFVADWAGAKEPFRLVSRFVMNNRDNRLRTHVYNNHRLVFRRGEEALKLFEAYSDTDGMETDTELSFDYSCMHDSYHSSPNQCGQGKEGSGLIYLWSSVQEGYRQRRIQALMYDKEKMIKGWHMWKEDGCICLEAPDRENKLEFWFEEDGFCVRRGGEQRLFRLF